MASKNRLQPLFTEWGKSIDKNCPLNDYPRPQMQRDNWQCLNGVWNYAIREDSSEPESWDGEILVPFSPESLLSGVERQLLPGQTLWYSREVTLRKPKNEERLLLHFGAVDQHCRVWCNGQLLGEHSGGYWPFSFDITDTLESECALLTIAVTDDSDTGNEAWGKQKLERGGIWYTGQSGIWQTVWCEAVPRRLIKGLRITPLYREGAVEVKAQFVELNEQFVQIMLEGRVSAFSEGILVAEAALENGVARLELPGFRSWSPDDPFLYDLEVCAGEDKIRSYFGMREFGVEEGSDGLPRLMLNGKPIFHNGLLDQGYWSDGMYTPPSDEAMIQEISRVKEMGFNMLRKHIKIEPLRWYYHCDRLGVLVWQDFVSGGGPYSRFVVQAAPFLGLSFGDGEKDFARHGRKSEAGRRAFMRDAERTVALLGNTVSLAVWVPFNEGWGQFNAAKVYEYFRSMDPSRQIDHASGYFDQGAGDLHSYHIYYRRFRPKKDKNPGRVLALTEFGGYSLPTEGHMASGRLFGYKVLKTQNQLHNALEALYKRDVLPAIRKGMGALVYTQVSDVEDEINGLFTYDRRVTKVDASKIKKLNDEVFAVFEESAGR